MPYTPATGHLQTITAPDGGTLAYTYDGALLTGVTWTGAVAGSVTHTYDNNFLRTATQVNGTQVITFQYDNDSLLTGAGSLTLHRDLLNGLLTGTTLGNVTDTLAYNGFAEVDTYSAAYNGTSVYAVQYTRDTLGRITGKSDTLNGVSTAFGYTYDLAGRLTQVTRNGVPAATYTYDNNGNRLSGPSVSTVATYDAQDRVLTAGTATYTYTANGERLTKTVGGLTTHYTYDELGNLLRVGLPDGTQLDYLVDGRNRRIGKWLNDVLVQGFVYEGHLRPAVELNGTGTVLSRFAYGMHVNVPDYMIKGGQTYRILTDHLGSPRLVINTADGTLAQRMDYDEFGNVLVDTKPGFQPFGFAGGLYDRDTRLTRFGARDYDADIGRWTVKDPIGFGGGDANLYGYVRGEPVNMTDPLGLMAGPFLMPKSLLISGPFGPVCGSGAIATWTPDGPWRAACAFHDRCYDTCGIPKALCDIVFLADSGNLYYYAAVFLGGDDAYRQAQAHCNSCPKGSSLGFVANPHTGEIILLEAVLKP